MNVGLQSVCIHYLSFLLLSLITLERNSEYSLDFFGWLYFIEGSLRQSSTYSSFKFTCSVHLLIGLPIIPSNFGFVGLICFAVFLFSILRV